MSHHVTTSFPVNARACRAALLDVPDADCDGLVTLAARAVQASAAVLCLDDGAHLRIKSAFGLSGKDTERLRRALAKQIRREQVSSSAAIRKDEEAFNEVLRSLSPPIHSSAAIALDTEERVDLGMLWVLDHAVREFSNAELTLLQNAARQILRLMELQVLRNARGSVPFGSSSDDETARRETELPPAEERFWLVRRAMRDTVWDWDIGSNRIWIGEGFESTFGERSETFEEWAERIHPEDRTHVVESLHRAIAGSQTIWSEEYRHVRPDGSHLWVEDNGSICRDADGVATRVVGARHDVTEKRRGQEELRRLEERFARAFQASPDPIAIIALDDSTFVDVNEAFLRSCGLSRSEVVGQTSEGIGFSWVDPEAGQRISDALALEGSVRSVEVKIRMRTGKIFLGLVSADFVEIDGRRCILMITKDITELRRLEEQLRQAQKMDAIGRLAGGIAHDFNNFLTIIHGYSELLLAGGVELADAAQAPLIEMRAAAGRAAGLTRQLLAFSRRQILSLQDLDLNRIIRSSERMLRSAISEQVDLRLRLDSELGQIQADSSQIDQVILNLVINARDAMPHGGSITIETRNLHYAAPTPFGHETVPAGRWVLLSVKDTGHGMSESVRSRIFEPFYTTKDEGEGTGLGLATVYGIVKQSGGYIAVSSCPGAGTTFEILLRRIDLPILPRGEDHVSRSPLTGSETILLVEDEESIRLLCSEVLESQGYTVLSAENGEEAMRMSREISAPIHLLLTDLVLPRLSGDALASTLRQQRPGIAVLYMSGLSNGPQPVCPLPNQPVLFLQKPFSPARLSRTVRDLLDHVATGPWLQ